VQISAVTYGGVVGSAVYTWQAADCGTIDGVYWVRPTGTPTLTGCFKMNGFGIGGTAAGPDFGTPAALTLTNATGLPLTTGVTGVLPSANGGLVGASILSYGASTASADNGPAINAAIAAVYAGTVSGPVIIPDGVWKATTQIDNPHIVDVISQGCIRWDGSGSSAIRIGLYSTVNPVTPSAITKSTYCVTRGSVNYADAYAGIEIVNVAFGMFTLKSEYFYSGVDLVGSGTGLYAGTEYNHIWFSGLYGNLKNVRIRTAVGTDTRGYVNENWLYGANAGHNTSYADAVASAVTFELNGIASVNSNKWFSGPIGEQATSTGGVALFEFSGAATGTAVVNNEFYGIRVDTSATMTGFLLNGSYSVHNNKFHFAYAENTALTWVAGSNAAAITKFSLNEIERIGYPSLTKAAAVSSFDRTMLVARTSGGNPIVQAPPNGLFKRTYGDYGYQMEAVATSSATLPTTSSVSINDSSALGVLVDVRNQPYTYLRKLTAWLPGTATGGRWIVEAFSTDGSTIVTSTDDIQFSPSLSLTASNYFLATVDSVLPLQVSWGSNVGFLFIGRRTGTAASVFNELKILAPVGSGVAPLRDASLITAEGISGNVLLTGTNPTVITSAPTSVEPLGTFVKPRTAALIAADKSLCWISTGAAFVACPTPTIPVSAVATKFLTAYTAGVGFTAAQPTQADIAVGAVAATTIAASGSTTYSVAGVGPILKQGANGRVGTFTCNGATPVTVSNTSVAADDVIVSGLHSVGGTVGASPAVQTKTASTGFTVACTAGDTSVYDYHILKSAP